MVADALCRGSVVCGSSLTKRVVVFVMRQAASSVVAQAVEALGLLVTLQCPLLSQVVTSCPGASFYSAPGGGMSVSPEVPSGGIGMLSASGVRNRLGRDPHRINGWVEVFVVGGRGGDPKGAYWMTEKDFRCGKFVGS